MSSSKPEHLDSAGAPVRTPGKAAVSAWIGSALEYYDFFIYGSAAALIFNKLFFSGLGPTGSTLASLATFGVAYVARPVGSFILGHIGDTKGRKPVLFITIFGMGAATFLIGCLPTYDQVGAIAPVLLRAPAHLPGSRRLRGAVRCHLDDHRARSRGPQSVLLQLHPGRNPTGVHPRHGRVPSHRGDAGRAAVHLGLADPVPAQCRRRVRRVVDPPSTSRDACLHRGEGRGAGPCRRAEGSAGLPGQVVRADRPAGAVRLPGVRGEHDLQHLRADLRRGHDGHPTDHDPVGADLAPTSWPSSPSRRSRSWPTGSAGARCSGSARWVPP